MNDIMHQAPSFFFTLRDLNVDGFPIKVTCHQVTNCFKTMFLRRSQNIESMHKQKVKVTPKTLKFD